MMIPVALATTLDQHGAKALQHSRSNLSRPTQESPNLYATKQQQQPAAVKTQSSLTELVPLKEDGTSSLRLVDHQMCAVPRLSDVLNEPRLPTSQHVILSPPDSAPARPLGDHCIRGKFSTATHHSADTQATTYHASVADTMGQGPEEVDSVDLHNWAAAKAGGKILAANQEAKRPHMVLDGDEDTFMRIAVKHDKWLILELPQVVMPNLLQIVQTELYSARLRDFQVHGRQSHPRVDLPPGYGNSLEYNRTLNSTSWELIGQYTAVKRKGTQSFKVCSGAPWVKFLLLQIGTVYGSEPNFAVNEIVVAGKSAAEELEDQLAAEAEHLLPLESPSLPEQQEYSRGNRGIHSGASVNRTKHLSSIDSVPPASDASAPHGGSSTEPHMPQETHRRQAQAVSSSPRGNDIVSGDARLILHLPSRATNIPTKEASTPKEANHKVLFGTEWSGAVGRGGSSSNSEVDAPLKTQAALSENAAAHVTMRAANTHIPAARHGVSRASAGGDLPHKHAVNLQHQAQTDRGSSSNDTASKEALPSGVPVGNSLTADVASSVSASDPGTLTTSQAMLHQERPHGKRMPSVKAVAAELGEPLAPGKTPKLLPSSRTGNSVYDTLIHEIKVLKVQARKVPRDLTDLRQDIAGDKATAAAKTAAVAARVEALEIQPAVVEALAAATAQQLAAVLARVEVLEAQQRTSRVREAALASFGAAALTAVLPRILQKNGFVVRCLQVGIVTLAGVYTAYILTRVAATTQSEAMTGGGSLYFRRLQHSEEGKPSIRPLTN